MDALNRQDFDENKALPSGFSGGEAEFSEMLSVLENGLKNLQKNQLSKKQNLPFEAFLLAESEHLLQQARRKINRPTIKAAPQFSIAHTWLLIYKWLIFNLFGHGMRESLATWQVR